MLPVTGLGTIWWYLFCFCYRVIYHLKPLMCSLLQGYISFDGTNVLCYRVIDHLKPLMCSLLQGYIPFDDTYFASVTGLYTIWWYLFCFCYRVIDHLMILILLLLQGYRSFEATNVVPVTGLYIFASVPGL